MNGGTVVNLQNVFYFKNIVDAIYPDEDRAPVEIQPIVETEKEKIRIMENRE